MRYLLVAFMGAIGALCRFGLTHITQDLQFPIDTLLINWAGCFLLEIIYSYLGRYHRLPKSLISGMGVGLLGSFTTLSAFCTESVAEIISGAYLQAFIYISLTFFGSFFAALAGSRCSRGLAGLRASRLLKRRRKSRKARR